MAIITIARELGAWTTQASKLLATCFPGQLFDRERIEQELLSAGVDADIIRRYDERKPGFFSALSADQDIYLLQLKNILLQAAAAGPIVVLGRCAHVLLEDIPGCLRLRLIAPEKTRIAHVMEEFKCDEDCARRLMRTCDADRAGFCRFHFNSDWADPGCYDMVINTEKLSDETLVEKLLWLSSNYFCAKELTAAGAILSRKLLAQRVLSHILVDCRLSLIFIEAEADDQGVITLRGAAASHDAVRAAEAAARQYPGVTDVKNLLRVSIELTHPRI